MLILYHNKFVCVDMQIDSGSDLSQQFSRLLRGQSPKTLFQCIFCAFPGVARFDTRLRKLLSERGLVFRLLFFDDPLVDHIEHLVFLVLRHGTEIEFRPPRRRRPGFLRPVLAIRPGTSRRTDNRRCGSHTCRARSFIVPTTDPTIDAGPSIILWCAA